MQLVGIVAVHTPLGLARGDENKGLGANAV